MATGDIENLVSALYAAYNAADADVAAGLYAPAGRHLEMATGSQRAGRIEVRDGLAVFLAAFADARWEERVRVVAEGRAAVSYLLTGTLHTRLGPFEPDGQRLELPGIHLLQFSAEGIVRCEDYWDAATFGRQMKPV